MHMKTILVIQFLLLANVNPVFITTRCVHSLNFICEDTGFQSYVFVHREENKTRIEKSVTSVTLLHTLPSCSKQLRPSGHFRSRLYTRP